MSSTLLEEHRYTISDIKLKNPPVPSLKIHKRIFLIEITKIIGGDNEPSSKLVEGQSQGNRIVWSEQILYNATADFKIHLKIIMKKEKKEKKDKSEIIGEYTTTAVSELLHRSSGVCNTRLGNKSQLSFVIKEVRFKDMLDMAKQKSKDIYFAEGKSWSMFFTYLGIVKEAIDPVASLNPLAQQIWSIVSMVPSTLQANDARTNNIKELFQQLLLIYEYINEADRLSVLRDTRTDQLRLLIDKTCECVGLIKEYTENNTTTNLIKGPIFDGRISEFKRWFNQIMEHNRDLMLLHMASNSEIFDVLSDMPYATSDVGLVEGKKCLSGTRETLIKEIEEWVNKDTTERILILSGHAGTGKSAVAHTIATSLNDQLGSFFCFNQNNKELVKFLFSTISRNLADRDDLWKRNLVLAVKDIAIRKSLDPERQFNEMIIKPSKGTTKRLVIIIDALDESGDQKERKILLPLLFERSSELPSNYRIIITSRPEHDIKAFHQHRNVCCKYMADVNSTDTLNDIQQVLSHELSGISETLNTVDKNWCSLLAQRAQSLFIWAKIACDYILELDELEAAQRLRIVLSESTSSLYEMYHRVLDAQPGCQFDSYLVPLKKCVGAVIVSRKPLSLSDLQAFFGPICGDSKNVQVVLKLLNSLFIGLDGQSTTHIQPIHTSVFDFFLSSDQKPGTRNRYYIDTSDQSSFTYACLRVMNGMLRFNICELETSHKRNRDIPNFESRVAQALPSCLSYACCFWAYHLERSVLNTDLREQIYDLMNKNLLYFFEVLSLLGEIEHGRSGMQRLRNITGGKDHELYAWAVEASKFLWVFGSMMTESTPHLYLSALPYISKESFISSQFLPQYPGLFSVDIGQPILSLRPQFKNSLMQRNPSSPPSVLAFSPQNRQLAVGFLNGDLWVWDYITGEMLCQTSSKEDAAVSSIVFSLNGELVYCCFEHGGILIWEEKTRNLSYEPNEGIAPKGCHFCDISPDGRFVAFKADEAMIYDRKTHVKPFEDIPGFYHWTISPESNAVMVSSRGRFVGIQPEMEVLRLWDTQEKTFISFVSLTNNHKLQALSDNYIIVYIRDFHSQEVYNIQTRSMVRRFQGDWIARFSPNGEDLLLCDGNKCLIWNVSTGKDSWRFLRCSRLPRGIHGIALSFDATHVAAFHNNTIHALAWDDLDREEINNWGEGDDDIEDEMPMPIYKAGGAWHKGQHLVIQHLISSEPGNLRVLDLAGTAVLNAVPVMHVMIDRRPGDHRLLVEVSPEDNHWTIAYVDVYRPSSLCLWNIDEKEIFTMDESGEPLTILAFSTSGDRLLSCDEKGKIKLWDVRTRTLSSCSRVSSEVTALAFSQTGTTFWVAYQRYEQAFVEERDSESHETINGPFSHDPFIRSIFVSSNDTYICVYSKYRNYMSTDKLAILDRSTGASIDRFNTRMVPAFSQNRKYVAWIPSGGERKMRMRLWDMEKGIALDEPSSDNAVRLLCFSNDSERICALGNVDGMDHVNIWNIQAKNIVTQCLLPESEFGLDWTWTSYPMALDGDSLLLVDVYGKVKVWNLCVYEIMTRLCSDHVNDPRFAEKFGHLQARRLIEDYNLRSEDTEVLDYALTAWNKASFSPWTKLSQDGWMLGPHGELLFWIPTFAIRMRLWYPSMSFMTCRFRQNFTKLSFEKFVHGTRWTECEK